MYPGKGATGMELQSTIYTPFQDILTGYILLMYLMETVLLSSYVSPCKTYNAVSF